MNVSLFDSTTIPALEQVVGFAQARHNVLASNIANLDTPGYRIRDISPEMFQKRLAEALEARDQQLGATSPGESIIPETDFADVRDAMQTILFHDGSDVGLEHQIAEISKNQMMHNMALTIMKSQLSLLQAAISERV